MSLTSYLRGWGRTLTGFAGAGGIGWLLSVLNSRTANVPESLDCRDVAGPETQYLDVNGCPVAYREMGAGPATLIFLHGFGGRLESWDSVQPALADECRTVALDLWGFGASGRPAPVQPRDWTTQVLGTMDALGIDSAVFVGHSLGGRVSLMCARQAPRRVRGMVLCDADYGQTAHGYALVWGLAHTPVLPAMMRRLRANPEHLRALMVTVYGDDTLITDEIVTLFHRPLCVRGTLDSFTGLARAHPYADVRGLADGVTCPVQLIWGADDPVIPAEWAEPLARKVRAVGCEVLPHCSHFPQEEQPHVVVRCLRDFLTHMDPVPAQAP